MHNNKQTGQAILIPHKITHINKALNSEPKFNTQLPKIKDWSGNYKLPSLKINKKKKSTNKEGKTLVNPQIQGFCSRNQSGGKKSDKSRSKFNWRMRVLGGKPCPKGSLQFRSACPWESSRKPSSSSLFAVARSPIEQPRGSRRRGFAPPIRKGVFCPN